MQSASGGSFVLKSLTSGGTISSAISIGFAGSNVISIQGPSVSGTITISNDVAVSILLGAGSFIGSLSSGAGAVTLVVSAAIACGGKCLCAEETCTAAYCQRISTADCSACMLCAARLHASGLLSPGGNLVLNGVTGAIFNSAVTPTAAMTVSLTGGSFQGSITTGAFAVSVNVAAGLSCAGTSSAQQPVIVFGPARLI